MTYAKRRRPGSDGRSRRRERGAALTEFALVMPVLAMLIMGIVTSGIAINNKQQITLAAREGARFGATLADDQCVTASDCGGTGWADFVRTVVVDRSGGTLTATSVCVALVSGPGSAPVAVSGTHTTKADGTACYADGSADEGPRVQVAVTRTDVLDAVVFRKTVQLHSRSVAQFES